MLDTVRFGPGHPSWFELGTPSNAEANIVVAVIRAIVVPISGTQVVGAIVPTAAAFDPVAA